MTQVPHYRPELVTFGGIASGAPVSATDWSTLGHSVNWVYGRGAQGLPVTAVLATVNSGSTGTLRFAFPSKRATVARRWALVMRAETAGASATVTINGTAFGAVYPPTSQSAQRESYVFVEELASKPAATGTFNTHSVAVAAASGNIVIETISCFDLPRRVLGQDTTDRGVNVLTLQSRQPIRYDLGESVGGVCDGEFNLRALRTGHYGWAVPTGDAISPGSTSYTALFEDPIIVQAAHLDGAADEALTCYVYAKVTGGTGLVRFSSAQASAVATASITGTSFAWVAAGSGLDVETEDLTAENGYRSGREEVTIEAADPSGQTLTIAAICMGRGGTDYT